MKEAGPLVADQLVFHLQFRLFEFVKADVVRVGAVFFFVDERREFRMLLLEGIDLGLIHRSHSFHLLD